MGLDFSLHLLHPTLFYFKILAEAQVSPFNFEWLNSIRDDLREVPARRQEKFDDCSKLSNSYVPQGKPSRKAILFTSPAQEPRKFLRFCVFMSLKDHSPDYTCHLAIISSLSGLFPIQAIFTLITPSKLCSKVNISWNFDIYAEAIS